MAETIQAFLDTLVGYIWGLPLVFLLLGGGVFFTLTLGLVQVRFFGHALRVIRGDYDNPDDPGEISHFKALCAALSATVGLGNIAGVAVAIKLGGPGATVWMIVAGLLGMALKYAECTLSVMYRHVDEFGVVHGGPMYYIEMGLGKAWKPLAVFFAICCTFATFGAANMFQANQVATILKSSFDIQPIVSGLVLAALTGVVIIGGIKRIGTVASILVPFMGGIYVLACLVVLFMNLSLIPEMLAGIFAGAFSGTAAVGGFAGAGVRATLVQGIRRAVFSNEAGMGSASIAHSAARTNEPVREGIVALLEPFVDTVVICTMTALVVNISGEWMGPHTGVDLTADALNHSIPGFGTYFIPFAVFLFAYSTLISWSYYGERAIDYLLGAKAILPYKIVFCCVSVVGATWSLEPIIALSDSMLGLMVFPNVIALLLLSPKVRAATREYTRKLKAGEFPIYR